MKLALSAVTFSLLALTANPCIAASPLTCEEFKSRLSEAIESAGNKVAQIKQYSLSSTYNDQKDYDWRGIVDLKGQLLCSKDDQFSRFDIMIDVPDTKSVAAALPRMRDLASATMCSVVQPRQSDCDKLALNMIKIAASRLSNEVKRGEEFAKGSSDYSLYANGWWVSLSADNVSVIFGMGPGTDGSAERRKLDPVNRTP